MLRIKLIKTGKKNTPTWRVVVVEKTKTGKGRVSDYIGNYNPHTKPKRFYLDIEKYQKWIKNGAQPTDTVKRLKGNFIDKNKEYQKEVKPKVYKKKIAEEQETKKIKKEEIKEEIKEEAAGANGSSPEEKVEAVETPAEETKENVEEKKEEVSAEETK